MGDISDYYRDQEFNRHMSLNFNESECQKGDLTVWELKDDSIIPIKNMSNSHLINSRKKIIRDSWRTDWLPNIEKELKSRNQKF